MRSCAPCFPVSCFTSKVFTLRLLRRDSSVHPSVEPPSQITTSAYSATLYLYALFSSFTILSPSLMTGIRTTYSLVFPLNSVHLNFGTPTFFSYDLLCQRTFTSQCLQSSHYHHSSVSFQGTSFASSPSDIAVPGSRSSR